jgi:hypothetical protein
MESLKPREIAPLFDKFLSRNLLHVAFPPKRVKFTQMALFIAERAYDLFLGSAPDGGYCRWWWWIIKPSLLQA